MNRILVIGATGNVGGKVVSQLPDAGVEVRALVRNPDAARLPARVEVVRGDLTAPETLDRALDGVDSVFLVWTAPAAAFARAFEKIAKYTRRIVFLSAPLKTPHPFFQQPNPARALAEEIERSIEASGMQRTFLRPGMFASDSLGWWRRQIRSGDVVRWPFLSVPTAPIDERDIAAVGVLALCEDGHAGAEYVITGPDALTMGEQIGIIGEALGRRLRSEEISPEDARKELAALMPVPVVKLLCDAWAAAAGHPAWMTSTVEEITGRPARKFRDWARDYAAEFQAEGALTLPG